MGCASSTPMVATAGSDMLKAATHVASDAAKGAENAVGEVTDTVGKTLESTKETVGTAVTGIAHDLSNAFTEKTNELDTAKNELLERLHLGGGGGTDAESTEQTNETSTNHLDTKALDAVARLLTPPPDFDLSQIPEPDIAHAMANSAEDTPPTSNATIAELEKLTTEVRQTAQTNVEELEATAAEGIAGAKHALTEASTAATEPVVDLIALLAAEKRPGTTEWEKHADHLSMTRKRNAFKGGGKFRRFGPAAPQIQSIHPANYILPIEPKEAPERVESTMKNIMKNSLLEDDSCYSDVYYNSRSSSPYSTSSNSPRLRRRRPRLPTSSVLAMNAKHMQREIAALLSDRRSAVRSLTVSPARGRHFDYNPQRVRYASPTPSMMGYTTPPIVIQTELPPLARTSNWKRNREKASLSSIPAHMVGELQPSSNLSSPPLNNVIKQAKIKPTKAFAPLRGQTTNGRSKIFGHTRTGSPVNRRAFANRSDVSQANKPRFIPTQSSSPVRTRALIQERIETAKKVERQMAQPKTLIRLEREASLKEEKAPSIAEMVANGFSLSRALSPIKMAAESHSLPHLSSAERKSAASTPHSLVEVVEQAVERTKSGTTRAGVSSGEVVMNRTKGKVNEVGRKAQNAKQLSSDNEKSRNKNQAKIGRSPKRESDKGTTGVGEKVEGSVEKENTPTRREIHTAKSNASSSRSRKQTPNLDRNSSEKQSLSSPRKNIMEQRNEGSADKLPSSASSNKKETFKNLSGYRSHDSWSYSSSGGQSLNRFTENDISKTSKKLTSLSPQLKYKNGNINDDLSRHSSAKGNSASGKRAPTNLNNWKSSSIGNSDEKYTNISNRFEALPEKNPTSKEIRSMQLSQDGSTTTTSSESNNSDLSQANDHGSRTNRKVIYSTETTEEYETNSTTRSYQANDESWNNENEKGKSKSSERSNDGPVSQDLRDLSLTKNEDQKTNPQDSTKTNAENDHAARKSDPTTDTNSQVPNSPNSSPSKSSKSSTSIVIRTIPSTPETEQYSDRVLSNRLREELGHHYGKIEEDEPSDIEREYYKEVESPQRFREEYETQHGITEEAIVSTTDTEGNNESPNPLRLEFEPHETVIEATILSTTETEDNNESESPNRLYEHNKQYLETTEDSNFSQTSLDDNTQTEVAEDSTEPPLASSSSDFEESVNAELTLQPPETNENTVIYAASSLEDLLKLLPPQTAYLKLGRSATMMALRSSTPIVDAQFYSRRSTPQRRYKRHSACDDCHEDKVPFVTELSSVARSRSPLVPLRPYKVRESCAVCYDKYVIK